MSYPSTKPQINGALIFQNKVNGQQIAKVPNQEYYAREEKHKNEGEFPTVYYQHQLDTHLAIKSKMILDNNPQDKNILDKMPWKLTNSEKYVDYLVDESTNELIPANTVQSLHLAYLNLNHFKPEEAFANIQDIIKKGGLKGTEEELALIEKIVQGIPRVIDNDTKIVQIVNPRYLAVQLQTLTLLSQLHRKNIKIKIEKMHPDQTDSNSKLALLLEKQRIEKFYDSFDDIVYKKMERYHHVKRNIPVFMQLELKQEYEILKHVQFKNDSNSPLHLRWQSVKVEYLAKERNSILNHQAEKKLRQKRAQQIAEELRQVKEIKLRGTALTQHILSVNVPDIFKNHSEEMNSLSLINGAIFQKEIPVQMPRLGMSDKEFLNNFQSFYEICQRGTDNQKLKIRIYCEKIIRANLYKNIQTSLIPDFSLVLLAVLDRPFAFPDPNFLSGKEPPESPRVLNALFERANKFPISIKTGLNAPVEKIISYIHPERLREPAISEKLKPQIFTYKNLDIPQYLKECDLESFLIEVEKVNLNLEQQTKAIIDKQWPINKRYEEAAPIIRKIDIAIGELRNNANKKNQELSVQYLADPSRRKAILNKTLDYINNIKKQKNQLSSEIFLLANSGPDNLAEKRKFELEKQGGYRSSLTWEDMNRLYLMADRAEYKKVTGLSDDNINKLHQKIADEIQLSILLQSNQRKQVALDKCEFLDPAKPDNHQSFLDLGLALSEKNLADFSNETDIQFFQKEEGILVNRLQKYYLNKLLNRNKETGKYDNELIQLIMGGGKSKVIGPVTAFKKAHGSNLVIYQVKSSLLNTSHADMNAVSLRLFGQEANLFKFDRNSPCSSSDLKSLYRKFYQTAVDKNYIMTSGESLQSLELKYLELLDDPPIGKKSIEVVEWEKQIKWLEKSLLFIKTAGDRIIDEYHDEIDPAKQLNYTIGSSQNAPKEDIDLEIELFYFFKKINLAPIVNKSITLFDLIKNNKLVDDPDNQWPMITKVLAESLVNDKTSPIAGTIKKLLAGSAVGKNDGVNPATIVNYLLNKDPKLLGTSQFKALSIREKDELSFLKSQVSGFLSFTMRRNLNEHYGPLRSPNISELQKLKAIPYRAKDMPNVRSNFGQFIVSMNYTMLMNIQTELNSQTIKDILEDFISKAKAELVDSEKLKIDQTLSYLTLNQSFMGGEPISLSKLLTNDKDYWNKCIDKCKKSENFKKYVLKNYVLPQNKLNPVVLSSDPQNMISMTHTNQAMTGTPWNFRGGHQDILFAEKEGIGTDGETIDLLKKKKTQVQLLANYASPYEMLKEAASKMASPKNMRAIVDVAALFKKETSNENVAKEIARYTNDYIEQIKYVLYFDNDEEVLYALDVKSNEKIRLNTTDEKKISAILKCSPAERFTYYDQARTVGTDIVHDEKAIKLLLIDEDTLQNKFAQGAKRARLLHKKQEIVVVAPDYMANTFHTKNPTIDDVTDLVADNQIKKLLGVHFHGSQQKFHNVVREMLLGKIYEEKDPFVKSKKMKILREVFSQSYQPTHFLNSGQISRQVESQKYFNDLYAYYTAKSKHYFERADLVISEPETNHMLNQLAKVRDQSIAVCARLLEKIPHKSADSGSEIVFESEGASEVENQIENETELELELEKQRLMYDLAVQPNTYSLNFNLYDIDSNNLVPLNRSLEPFRHEYKFRFDDKIYMTHQFSKTHQTQSNILDVYTKPVEAILMRQSKSNPPIIEAVVMTKKEGAALLDQVNQASSNQHHIWMVSPQGTFYAGNPPERLSGKYEEYLEQIRFFNGDAKLLASQKKDLAWCSKDADQKLKFFDEVILPLHPTQAKYFEQLTLRLNVLNKIYKEIIYNPETNFINKDWSIAYPEFKKIPVLKQNTILELAKACWEMREAYYSYSTDSFFENATFNLWLEKHSREIRPFLEHRKAVIELNMRLIKAISSTQDFNRLNLEREVGQIDWNFMAQDGQTAFQKVILRDDLTVELLNGVGCSEHGINWKMVNNQGVSNFSSLAMLLDKKSAKDAYDFLQNIAVAINFKDASGLLFIDYAIENLHKTFPSKDNLKAYHELFLKPENTSFLKILVEYYTKKASPYADVEDKSKHNEKLMIAAIVSNDLPLIMDLVSKNISTQLRFKGKPLISVALSFGCKPEIIEYLISQGAKVYESDDDEFTPLYWAIASGIKENVSVLLKNKASVYDGSLRHDSPLNYAVGLGCSNDIVHMLIQARSDLNAKDNQGMTPLLLAAQRGNAEHILLLLDNHAEKQTIDNNGSSPLHLAVENDHKDVAQLLIQRGMPVDAKDNAGNTSLIVALKKGHIDMARLLVENGAKVDEKDEQGNSPLLLSVERGYRDFALMLIDRNAEINITDPQGTPLLLVMIERGDAEFALKLLDKGANIDEKDAHGNTALILALKRGRLDLAHLLIQRNAKVNVKDKSGQTPLLLALEQGGRDFALMLIDEGADVNVTNSQGSPILMLAIDGGDIEFVNKLLDKGAKIDEKDINGNTALSLALSKGHLDVARLLIQRGANVNEKDKNGLMPLQIAVGKKYRDVALLLIEKKAEVNVTDSQGSPILLSAIDDGDTEFFLKLLDNGAKIDEKYAYGNTALLIALKTGHIDMVHLLIQKGADVFQKDKEGQTALHLAAEKADVKLALILLDKKAVVDEKDGNGMTALMLAAQKGHIDIVLMLIEKGADVKAVNNKKESPLAIADRVDPAMAKAMRQKIIQMQPQAKVPSKPVSIAFSKNVAPSKVPAKVAAVAAPVSKVAVPVAKVAVIAKAAAPAAAHVFGDEVREQITRIANDAKRALAERRLKELAFKPEIIDYLENDPEKAAMLLAQSDSFLASFNIAKFAAQKIKLNNLPEKIVLAGGKVKPTR